MLNTSFFTMEIVHYVYIIYNLNNSIITLEYNVYLLANRSSVYAFNECRMAQRGYGNSNVINHFNNKHAQNMMVR